MNKKWFKLMAGVALSGFVAGSVIGATANLTDRFDEPGAWFATGDGSSVASGGALALVFNAQPDFPIPQKGGLASASEQFTGNLQMLGIEAVQFDVRCDELVSAVQFAMNSDQVGCEWFYPLTVPAGEWVTVTVPFTYVADWTCVTRPETKGLFEACLATVSSVSVRGYRDGNVQVDLELDNFKLIGPWGGPFTADGLPQSWLLEYFGSIMDGRAGDDDDQDGLSNYGEFLANTLPTDENSFFAVSIAKNVDGKQVLQWDGVSGKTFGIWQATDLVSGFSKVAGGVTGTEFEVNEDGPFFYKVEIEQ